MWRLTGGHVGAEVQGIAVEQDACRGPRPAQIAPAGLGRGDAGHRFRVVAEVYACLGIDVTDLRDRVGQGRGVQSIGLGQQQAVRGSEGSRCRIGIVDAPYRLPITTQGRGDLIGEGAATQYQGCAMFEH